MLHHRNLFVFVLATALSVCVAIVSAHAQEPADKSEILSVLATARLQAETAADQADENKRQIETMSSRVLRVVAPAEQGDFLRKVDELRKQTSAQLDEARALATQAVTTSEQVIASDAVTEALVTTAVKLLSSASELVQAAAATKLDIFKLSEATVRKNEDVVRRPSSGTGDEGRTISTYYNGPKSAQYRSLVEWGSDSISLEALVAPASVGALDCIANASCTPVPIYFGTDRSAQKGLNRLYFTAARNEQLTLGKAVVTVPRAHRSQGEVNRPSWWDLLRFRNPFREDPTVHFTIPDGGITVFPSPEAFIAEAKAHMQTAGNFKDHVFVFVHGYNVEFDDALFRAAQIAFDLGDGDTPFGTAFVYSWPSVGATLDYPYDFDSARLATDHLEEFLALVLEQTDAEHVHLIAHSMGNWPLVNVLQGMAAAAPGTPKINQVILAAPDIDAGEFQNIAASIGKVAEGVTLYASANDRAMRASREVHNDAWRAGDLKDGVPVIVAGIDSVDVSAINTDFLSLNHSTYADTKELLNDIWRLMRTGERPPHLRNNAVRRMPTNGGDYWRYIE
jgi:esterase/lipase superfamily enzyme